MTIEQFIELLTEDSQIIKVWDLTSERKLYQGDICNMPNEIVHEKIASIDTLTEETDIFTLNIE